MAALLWALVVVLRRMAARHPEAVERLYAREIYAVVARVLSAATGWLPFSLSEAVAVAAVLGAAVAVTRRAARRGRGQTVDATGAPPPAGRASLAARALLVLAAVAAGVLAFDLVWALNYERLPLAQVLGYPGTGSAPPSVLELAALTTDLVTESGRMRAGLPEDGGGVMRLADGGGGALARAPLGYAAARLSPLPVPEVSGRPKRVLLSPVMSYLGITGIFIPFTSEANVNVTLPDWELPFTAAHELAHQRGYAREDEANYVAYLACRAHPDRDFQYSGTFRAALYAMSALSRADRAAFDAARAGLTAPLRRDLAALAAWRARYESRLSDVHDRVNDAYLKTQGQAEGVRSYGRMVDLLLAGRRGGQRDGNAERLR